MVYVGSYPSPWKGQEWFHLLADTPEELHEFAKKIGMKYAWFQNKRVPHYDVNTKRRAVAISLGAKVLTIREEGDKMHEIEQGIINEVQKHLNDEIARERAKKHCQMPGCADPLFQYSDTHCYFHHREQIERSH